MTSRDEALKLALEIVHGDEPYPTGNSPHTRLSCAKILARALIESEEERERLSDAIYIQRAYAVTTGALTTPSAMHAMMQRMVDDIDAALRREEVRDD